MIYYFCHYFDLTFRPLYFLFVAQANPIAPYAPCRTSKKGIERALRKWKLKTSADWQLIKWRQVAAGWLKGNVATVALTTWPTVCVTRQPRPWLPPSRVSLRSTNKVTEPTKKFVIKQNFVASNFTSCPNIQFQGDAASASLWVGVGVEWG